MLRTVPVCKLRLISTDNFLDPRWPCTVGHLITLSKLGKSSLILFTTLLSPLTMLPASHSSGCSTLPAAQTSLDPVRTVVRALVRKPGDYEPMGCLHIYVLMCLCVCVFIFVSVCASLSLTSYACLRVSLCMCICVCLCVSICLCVCLCH